MDFIGFSDSATTLITTTLWLGGSLTLIAALVALAFSFAMKVNARFSASRDWSAIAAAVFATATFAVWWLSTDVEQGNIREKYADAAKSVYGIEIDGSDLRYLAIGHDRPSAPTIFPGKSGITIADGLNLRAIELHAAFDGDDVLLGTVRDGLFTELERR